MLDVVLEARSNVYYIDTDDAFNPCCAGCSSGSGEALCAVAIEYLLSILVVLDVVLEATIGAAIFSLLFSFNPCCAGCSSGRAINLCWAVYWSCLSILVVLDVVLEAPSSSIPCMIAIIFQSLLCWM